MRLAPKTGDDRANYEFFAASFAVEEHLQRLLAGSDSAGQPRQEHLIAINSGESALSISAIGVALELDCKRIFDA